ncbi:2-oxoacid:acceptor oxidoreductase family protein [Paenibacillus sp. HN-1]|uniref:2-oxoacid:acceptor oxidoreductase family protein n=1 Tax=Paenibacillus TaxID=44249 RepID=UPI001CA86222|nr:MULTISPECIES: 2-oxoacid:acceptor oxidoreductase family protein [Paenibacillus]MBY9078048.1 2-oxoacid:acceptor oxidoreductase family protein [Paenibacillus sp. CGMCC 1.18879]MBY9083789.1 2-oxoacid:acceptor oxidoreductase family protein [Paenibacillus sinensis]
MSAPDKGSYLICGLGGQGIGLFGKILGEYYTHHGYEIKISDVMGLGQRGGSVECHFRYSTERIYSPLIPFGTAEALISFEQIETLRNAHYLKKEGRIISSTYELSPPTVNTRLQADVQGSARESIQRLGFPVRFIDDAEIDRADPEFNRVRNMIALAVLAEQMELDIQSLIELLKNNISPSYLQLNLRAFEYGRQLFERTTAY